MIYLLDSNILIFLIKNQPPAIAHRVNTLPEDSRLCMSFITWAELLKGTERSTRKPEVLRRLDPRWPLQIPPPVAGSNSPRPGQWGVSLSRLSP